MSKFAPVALVIVIVLLGIQSALSYFRPSSTVVHHAAPPSLITTPDGKLEIRTTSADQRVFYRETKNGIVCSEPSPDATLDTALHGRAGIGAGLARGLGASGEAEASQAQQATTSAIFTRSQSVQFLRDTMYYLCQAQMNGKLDDDAYMKKFDDLVRRSYDLLLTELRAKEAALAAKQPQQQLPQQQPPESQQTVRRKQ
jgi:hypothetical protein